MDANQPSNKDHYDFSKYTTKEGFISYYMQVKETLDFKPTSCLVIGQGDNIVPSIIRSQGIEVDTFDILAELSPTYLGNLIDIDNIITKKYDVVLCCEVLEHLPYEMLDECLQKIRRISIKGVVISIPVFGLSGYIKIWAPKYINLVIPIITRLYKPGYKVLCNEHFWEINSKENSVKAIIKVMERYFVINKRYRLYENPYHMFFILS